MKLIHTIYAYLTAPLRDNQPTDLLPKPLNNSRFRVVIAAFKRINRHLPFLNQLILCLNTICNVLMAY